MKNTSVLVRARVPERRLRRAEEVLDRLGLTPGDAINMLMAQIDLRQGLPFNLSVSEDLWVDGDTQAEAWTEAMGAY